jgi:hypothetical protein
MIEKILLRDKKYNYVIKKINEKEQEKKILTEKIKKLEEEFLKLKNQVVVDIDTINKKDLKIIKSKDYDSSKNNELLIKEEIELNQKVNFNKELYNLVSLRYDQVINSLRKLSNEKSINYLKKDNQNASLLNNNQSGNASIDNNANNINSNNNENNENNENSTKEKNNKSINNLNQSINISLLDENEVKKIIDDYKDYLLQAEKKIESLLLMKTKKDFLQMIRDKVT